MSTRYLYDDWGWYSGTTVGTPARSTEVAPVNFSVSTVEGALRSNWTGHAWIELAYFEPPAIEEPPIVSEPRRITNLAFRNRFTTAEKIALELAAADDPAAPLNERQMAAALRANMKDADAAKFIDLDRADTRAGVLQLEQLGLIAEGRANVILDAAITDMERYDG